MSQPERASDLLKSIMRGIETESSRSDLAEALEQVLGPSVAESCRILGFRKGSLVVEVDSAPLYAELSGFRRDEIRERMNDLLTKKQVARIVFRMGGTGHV